MIHVVRPAVARKIFGKLQVQRRTEAIARARALGLA
jgi:ATP/maltotriose-dependent transcriptional regulator MalT